MMMNNLAKIKMQIIFVGFCISLFTLSGKADETLDHASSLLIVKKTEEAQRLITGYLHENNDPKSYIQVGNLFARLKLWPEAVHYYEIAVTRNGRDALAWYQLGVAQHQKKNVDEAVASLRKSIAISSNTVKSVMALGEVLELARDRFDARQIYLEGLKKIGDRADIRSKLCWLNFQDSFFRETLANCQKAIELNPSDVVSDTLLAVTLYNSEKQDEAFKKFKKIVEKFPREPLPFRARGILYFQEKSYEQATLDLGKAFGLDALDDEAGIHLARALFELKHYEQALPIYFEACRLNKSYRFEFVSKQRELARKNHTDLAEQYKLAIEKI